MFPIPAPGHFRIIAHRGASAYAPENTLPAFQLAKAMGAREVELDTQLSADGVVVLCHDDTLERFGHGPAVVEEQRLSWLLSLDMGAWFSPYHFARTPLLTLDELLCAFAKDFVFHVELKGRAEGLAGAVYTLVDARGLLDRCIFTSFSYRQLERMRAVSNAVRLGWLVDDIDAPVLDDAAALDVFQLCPRAHGVTGESVARAKTVAPEVRAWGLNGTPLDVRRLVRQTIDAGCDGITINWPDRVTHRGADSAGPGPT